MKFSALATATALALAPSFASASRMLNETSSDLPEINDLMNIAFPMWEVNGKGERDMKKATPCTVDDCQWNPFYVTKRYDGLHPDFGGHPSDNDVKYAFFASSPFAGQPYPGTPHHCPPDALDNITAGECPKIKTTSDFGAEGPGHVPPHIGLASLTWAVRDGLFSMEDMFDYENFECRVIPNVLFQMVRNYFPRTEGEIIDYPPPIVPEGGDFQYEFPSGRGLENQEPPYEPGPPHWCTEEMLATGHWDGVCPYIFEGPDAGKYRHPHIAYAALEVYLANQTMPDKCATTWLQNNPWFLDEDRLPTDTPFPVMSNDNSDAKSLKNWLGQPVLPWSYESGDARDIEVMSAEATRALLDIEDPTTTTTTEAPTTTETAAEPEPESEPESECTLQPIPTNPDDFDEPHWETILELAFPTWNVPANGCPRLDSLGGTIVPEFSDFPVPEDGKFNPCYYTKAFAGLDPKLGGYPTPIDTRYPYEYAAPFQKQPGDGSTHHCTLDAIDIGACPKFLNDCGKDCASVKDGVPGHIPPFVALAAIKNAYNSCTPNICSEWFDFESSGCSIQQPKLDELVIKYFGDGDTIKFQPPILLDGKPSSTYYRLEYLGESPACDDGNCRGPHYCSKEVADEGVIWGDFCPYVLTGENSGQYRHPHLALAALELWIANQCMPEMCAPQWLDSPNGQGYGVDSTKSTAIVWAEMDNNDDPMAQPAVPYKWPNSESGIYPGHTMLYGDSASKEAPAPFVIEFVDVNPDTPEPPAAEPPVADKPKADEPTADEPAAGEPAFNAPATASEPSSAWLMPNTMAIVFTGLACILMM